MKNSSNPLPYALSWWLDIVSPQWDGLVMDNYTAVMPVTWNRKLGIYYLWQPWFTQQLGVFSAQQNGWSTTSEFLAALPTKYRYIDIQLNTDNFVTDILNISHRTNFILDLSPDYIQIESNYHRNCRRNIQKALHNGLYVNKGPGPSVFSRFVRRNLDRSVSANAGLFRILPGIIQATIDRSFGFIYGVYDRRKELNAAAWFVNYSGRILFLVCASTSTGKKNQAMSLLVDHVIREKAGTNTVFDFTGSNMPGVAYFNSGFGAVRQQYPRVKRNTLPWLLRLFKK